MAHPRRSYRPAYRATGSGRGLLSGSRPTHGATVERLPGPTGRRGPLTPVPPRDRLMELVAEIEAERTVPTEAVRARPCCSECGVVPPGKSRDDGKLRRHRVRVDDPTAPWCSASPEAAHQ